MSDQMAILKDMLVDDALVSIEDHPQNSDKHTVTLTEGEQYSVKIYGIPEKHSIFVLKTDKFPAPVQIFKGSKGECKRSDFVIFIEKSQVNYLLFIELKAKSKTEKAGHIVKQFKGAQCVVQYIAEVGKQFWGKDLFVDIKYRFILLTDMNLNKQSTRHTTKHQTTHHTPENMLIIKAPTHVELNQLIGKKA